MSSHVYHEMFVHMNWHTKGDHPILRGQVEELSYAALRQKAATVSGVHLHFLGGTDTHVHLAVQYEPRLAVAQIIQELKGASAHSVNERLRHKALQWQRGYGAVSFGHKNLAWIAEYIQKQREHHARGTIQPRLESCESEQANQEQEEDEQ
jgi:putative transposase